MDFESLNSPSVSPSILDDEHLHSAGTGDKRKAPEKSTTDEESPKGRRNMPKRARLHSPIPSKGKNDNISKQKLNFESNGDNNNEPNHKLINTEERFSLPLPSLIDHDNNKIIPSKDTDSDNDSDNSDKFFMGIKEREEQENDHSAELKKSLTSKDEQNSYTFSSIENSRACHSLLANLKNKQGYLSVEMRVFDPVLKETIFSSKGLHIKSDYTRVYEFLKNHELLDTGYSADIESSSNTDSCELSFHEKRSGKFSMASTISKDSNIRTSIRSSLSSTTTSRDGKFFKSPNIPEKSKVRILGENMPLLSSTFMENKSTKKVNRKSMSNGDQSSSQNDSNVDDGQGQEKLKKGQEEKVPDDVSKNNESENSSNTNNDSSLNFNISGNGNEKKKRGRKKKVDTTSTSTNISALTLSSPNDSNSLNPTPPPSLTQQRFPRGDNSTSQSQSSISSFFSDTEVEESKLINSPHVWGVVGVGELVFARWRDKNYYSGVITNKGMNDTWEIAFDDQLGDVASETHILPLKILGVGTKVVYCPDVIYQPETATVLGHLNDNETIMYAIKCAKKDKPIYCARRHLTINENEAKDMRKGYQYLFSTTTPKAADISLDNIVGRRLRSTPGPSSTNKNNKRKKITGGVFDYSTTDEALLKTTPAVPPLHPTATPVIDNSTLTPNTPMESGYLTGASTFTSTPVTHVKTSKETQKTVTSKEVAIIAPKKSRKIQTEKPKLLFEGLQFFLTASGGSDPSSSGDELPIAVPYDKDIFKVDIEEEGGKIIDVVGKENNKGKNKDNIFLISDSYARTVKYIYCLAAGIPCISHVWVKKCIDENKLYDWKDYQLNAGWSIEREQVIPHHKRKPLKDVKVYVLAESEELYNYWKPVLTAAQAKLLKLLKDPNHLPADTQVLVTDSSCSKAAYELGTEKEIPIVFPEWLVQTIITGEQANHNGHEKYIVQHVNHRQLQLERKNQREEEEEQTSDDLD